MVKEGIKIFSRIKPTKKECGSFEIGKNDEGIATLSVHVPRCEASGHVNNRLESYTFQFTHVFDQAATQEQVFDLVAKGVIDNCLEGYNGTIFAYGQTGSGKTFTITGGTEKYSDRGIIPRTLSYVYSQYQKNTGLVFTTHISYLEIYNDSGYDLLDPRHEASKLEELPKVHLLEDSTGNIHLKNLSLHQVTNEEEALNWLFLGDTNRMIAETPMNMASTRSHCIFTIHFSAREPGSDTIKKSKLHLVDLAGSERVGKTKVAGTLLAEAKYINLSLHYLEQVIVALSEKSRVHIPYRNTMMTSVLRDSLGGNCMTSMIATCAVERGNIDETISTCRFSQRVALVKNEAIVNEELDPKLMVARLKQQVQELRDELTMATGEERTDELTEEEKKRCGELVSAYVMDTDPEARLQVGADMRKIQLCFQLLKNHIKQQQQHQQSDNNNKSLVERAESSGNSSESTRVEKPSYTDNKQLQELQELLKQRDNEISILVEMLKREKNRAAAAEASLHGTSVSSSTHQPTGQKTIINSDTLREQRAADASHQDGHSQHESSSSNSQLSEHQRSHKTSHKELSHAKQEAFDTFRRDYKHNLVIESHKNTLRARYADAKELGEQVNRSRTKINELKSQIERHRLKRGLQGLTEGSDAPSPDSKEDQLKRDIENEKANFKELYGHLKDMKTEIEHVQHLLEKAKVQLQKDFDIWWKQQGNQVSSKSAWVTPTPPSSSGRPLSSSQSRRHMAATFPEQQKQQKSDTSSSSSNTPRLMMDVSPSGTIPPIPGSSSRITASESSTGKFNNSDVVHNQLRSSNTVLASKTSTAKMAKSHSNDADSSSVSAIPLTGDSRADADIIAFYKARQRLIKRK